MILSIDFETASKVDLPKRGGYVYARHPSTKVLLAGYAIDDFTVQVWDARDPMPYELSDALRNPFMKILAHNAQFERLILKHVLKLDLSMDRFHCTQAMAAALSFSGSLDQILDQAGLATAKLAAGKDLIKLFSIKQMPPEAYPEEWATFIRYCKQDVVATRILFKFLSKYDPAINWSDYHMDQRINDAGVPVDMKLVKRAIAASHDAKLELHIELARLTGLANPNSTQQFKGYLERHGVKLPNCRADTLREVNRQLALRAEPKDMKLHDIIRKRLMLSRSSLAKWEAIKRTQIKGSIHGMFQFLGAARTGRWAGRLVQLQNLPRPTIADPDLSAEILRDLPMHHFGMFHDDVLGALSSMIRSAIWAPRGRRWVVADLSSIEGRIGGWLTGCSAVNQIFADGKDQYMEFAKHVFDTTDPTREQRNIAKPAVLGCQYRLGAKGLQAYAYGMGVVMTRKEAHKHVRTFRTLYHEIPTFWETFEFHVLECAREGIASTVYGCYIHRDRDFLVIALPSGRSLFYHKPEVRLLTIKYEDEDGVEQTFEKDCFTFKAYRNSQWVRISAHAGHLLENIVQALARDVLVRGMSRADALGLDIRGHVHDEVMVLSKEYTALREFEMLIDVMTAPMPWAKSLKLGADGYIARRYRK